MSEVPLRGGSVCAYRGTSLIRKKHSPIGPIGLPYGTRHIPTVGS